MTTRGTETDDATALRLRFLTAVASAAPPLHAKDLRVPGLDRRTVQKRLERLRRVASTDIVATDEETIAYARDELLRSGPPVQRGLAKLRSLAASRATEFARRAGLQSTVIGDWIELAHSPGDLGWAREQVAVEELGEDTLPARGRLQGWGVERDRYLEELREQAPSDPDVRRNLEPNRMKMDLVGFRTWGTRDAPLCAIQVAPIDWLTCFALNARLEAPALTAGGEVTVRERWGDPVRAAERRGLPGMLVAHVVVLTSDGHFVTARRQAAGIEDERGTWSLSIEERWQGASDGREGDRHPHDVVRRAVREELGLAVAEEDIRILAWGLEASVLYPGFIALARTAASSWEIEDRRAHAGDANELTYVTSFPARLSSAGLMLPEQFAPVGRPELEAPWHRTARARLFVALAYLESLAGRDGRQRALAQLGR